MSKSSVFPVPKKNNDGFRLEIFNLFIIILTIVVTIALSFVVYKAHSTYDAFQEATNEYITCRMAAEHIHDASDYLSKQVRDYAYSGNIKSVDRYFREANVTKRRENAIETIKKYVKDPAKQQYLESAVQYSMQLMNIEYHSMRLVFEANGVDKTLYPDEIKAVELTQTEKAMSSEEKIQLAKEIVKNNTYDSYKEAIYENISLYTKDLLDETEDREQENAKLFSTYQQIQLILIIILICILMLTVAFTSVFLLRPLRKNSRLIVKQDSLPVKGPAEMKTFARLYNKVLEKTKRQQEKLFYEASHDSLTGIRNRSVFDDMYRSIKSTDHLSLMIVDIDHFKEINDTYGHEAGDGVLKRVASILRSSFRADDIICRIGGDEFTVILSGVTAEQFEQLNDKINGIMAKLRKPERNLPDITISVGVAFGEKHCPFDILYKRADKALYSIKSTTRNGVGFYEE